MVVGTSKALSETLIWSKPISSRMRTSHRAASTMRCHFGGGVSPSARGGSGGRLPSFTPTRMGTPRSWARRTTVRTFSASRMLPGLRRRPWTPALSAASARR